MGVGVGVWVVRHAHVALVRFILMYVSTGIYITCMCLDGTHTHTTTYLHTQALTPTRASPLTPVVLVHIESIIMREIDEGITAMLIRVAWFNLCCSAINAAQFPFKQITGIMGKSFISASHIRVVYCKTEDNIRNEIFFIHV